MRLKNLTRSVSIILMLLAMMFSCQPVTEDVGGSNNGGSNSGNQNGGNAGGEQTADSITITLIGTDSKEYDKFAIKIGEEIELPANVERFVCWNTKADGSGESYKGKSKFTKDMTLYLIVLAENAYTITYELNGGVNDKTNPLSFTADDKITLKNPSKDGYRFSGWYEKADFSGTAVKGWAAGDKKANVTLYAKWRDVNDKEVAQGGTGVYSYVTYIDALSGNKNYPSFSIFLMTAAQVTALTSDGGKYVEKSEFAEATKTEPIYQICSYGEMGTDTTKSGDYAVWGRTPLNGKLECYEGIAASIKGTDLTVTVDMTKLANAELKAYKNGEETFMTDDDTVILNNYKPYISMSLDYDNENYNSYIVEVRLNNSYKCLYEMNVGATFPTVLKEDALAVPTYRDLTYFVTNISQLPVELKNNAFTFVAPVGVETNQVMFYFMNYNPYDSYENYPVFPIQIGGEKIDCLNKNFQLDDLFNPKQPFYINSGVLTAGKMYTITLDVRGDYEAYAKVSEKKAKSISINSENHKTSYYVGDDINVANLTVEATTSDGTKVTVNVTADMISGFDSSKLGKQTLTITMDGCTATYSVEVSTANVTEHSVTASEVVETIKGLTDGEYYKIKVSGTLDSNTMSDIQDALRVSYNAADYPKIALDLSNTTGLTYCNNSFYDCKGLTSIVFPEGMTSIPSFSSCDSLTSITIPASVENVSSISNCKKFTTFEVAENSEYFSTSADGKILYSKDKTVLFSYPSASGDVTIPNGVTSIGYDAFSGCNSLTSVIIPDSVISIGSDAFENCENLESVTIGAGVTSISSDSFSGCSSLTNIKVSANNQNYSTDGKILYNKDKTTLKAYPSATGAVTIPNGVTEIGDYAFSDSDITSVTIPDSVKAIGSEAFYGCSSLESVTFGNGVTEIYSYAFSYCRKLTTITIPDSVKAIRSRAFDDCQALESVIIGSGVKEIGYGAFSYCGSLASVTFKDTDGWCYSGYDTGNVDINVTDAAQNATYLTDTYCDYTWKKVVKGMYISGLNSKWAGNTDSGDADIMTKGANDVYTFTFTAENTQPFPYGFKFTTEKGWQEQYQAYNKNNHTTDITILTPGQEAGVYFITEEEISASYENNEYDIYEDDINDSATKFNVGALSSFIVGNKYTITFDKAKMTVKISGEFKTLSYNDLKYIYGGLTDYEYVELVDNSYTFVADDYYYWNDFSFYLTENGEFSVGGATITSLGAAMFELYENDSDCSFEYDVLTPGNEYTISLKVFGKDEAYVQVTEK